MAVPFRHEFRNGKAGFHLSFQDDPVAKIDGFRKKSQPASNRLPSRALQSTAV
jgi:hypothetical protein